VNGQSQYFNYFAGNQMSSFFSDTSLSVVKSGFGQQMDPVATNHRFPIQSVGSIQRCFGGFGISIYSGRRAEQGIHFLDVGVLAGFVVGNDHSGMPSFLVERKHENVPLFHGPLLFEVFGSADHRGFGQAVVLLDFCVGVGIGKIPRRAHWDRLELRNFPQNKPALTRDDINRLAPAGFFHQAAQIRFGSAQRERWRAQIDLRFSGMARNGTFHGLKIACIQAGVEQF
jgi:hypothetical protein